MKLGKSSIAATCLLIVGILLLSTGCQKLKARDELNKGVAEYKAMNYPMAVSHFKEAIELDPTLINARLYLATAYANQYVPGSESDDNVQNAEQAIETFQMVLSEDPANVGSVSGIASLYFQMKRLDDAKDFYQKQIELDPTNPDPYYSVGVINWTKTYQPRMELKNELGIAPPDPITDADRRRELAELNLPLVEEGLEHLNEAMNLREDYDDAMAYVNLLYRERADLQESGELREEDLQQADSWMEKSLEIKKARVAGETGAEGG